MRFDDFVARLPGKKQVAGNGVLAFCPSHENTNTPALSVSPGDDRILLNDHGANCTAEAITAAMGLTVADLYYAARNGNGNGTAPRSPLTLEAFAQAKGFTVEFLAKHGVHEEKGALVFRYLTMNGQKAERQRIRLSLAGDRRFIWNSGKGRPVPYGLWLLGEARKRGVTDLVACEGESDTLTFLNHGIAALGIPGADLCSLLAEPHVRGFKRIFIVRENDAKPQKPDASESSQSGGETFEKGCVGRFAQLEFDGQVFVVEMVNAEGDIKDPNELHLRCLGDPGGFEAEWNVLVEQARKLELPRVGLEVYDASMVKEKLVEWAWRHRIPFGMLALYVGIPGLGKSFAALDVVAHLSNGSEWPDGAPNGLKVDSIVFSAEDTLDSVIVPRLRLLGADLGRIKLVKRIKEANESGEVTRRSFSLLRDLPHLEKELDKNPNIKLVVIDPISGYMARAKDSYNNSEMRSEVLDPLAELAERRNVAILAVTHFNKGVGSGNALDKISGSVAFPAAARAVWGFVKDPDDDDWNPTPGQKRRNGRVLMVFGKSNVGPPMPGLAYRVVGLESEDRGALVWIKGDVDSDLRDVLAREREQDSERRVRGRPPRELDAARELLIEMLSAGPVLSAEIEAAAYQREISPRTLATARRVLGVQAKRENGKWWASLPTRDRENF